MLGTIRKRKQHRIQNVHMVKSIMHLQFPYWVLLWVVSFQNVEEQGKNRVKGGNHVEPFGK